MAEAWTVSRRFVFGNPEDPVGVMTVPIACFVDKEAADKGASDIGQIHNLSEAMITVNGKNIMPVRQFLGALGISGVNLVTFQSRIREASLIVAPSLR